MESTNFNPTDYEKKLIYAIGQVTYVHTSGLEEVLSQLLAALHSDSWEEYTQEYEKSFEMGFRKKVRRIRALANQQANNGEICENLSDEIEKLLRKSENLTDQRNEAVHSIHDPMWEGSDFGASNARNFVLQTDFGVRNKTEGENYRKIQPEDFIAISDKMWQITQKIAKIAHSHAPQP